MQDVLTCLTLVSRAKNIFFHFASNNFFVIFFVFFCKIFPFCLLSSIFRFLRVSIFYFVSRSSIFSIIFFVC